MPMRAFPDVRLPRPDHRATLDHLPGSDVPVIRQPFDPSDAHPVLGRRATSRATCSTTGPKPTPTASCATTSPTAAGRTRPREMADLLVEALRAIEAPAEQLARLGLG